MQVNSTVKHVILVLSGKGGVGKTTVSVQLALGLREKGYNVGLLDVDLCGPSVPHLLGLEGSVVHRCPEGWVPVYADKEQKLAVMSTGFLLSDNKESVIWRGPKKTSNDTTNNNNAAQSLLEPIIVPQTVNGMIKQFLQDVYWQKLDYLIIDTPPGTSDEHITVVENLVCVCEGAVIVTTPQLVALEDVKKELSFCNRTGVNVLGIIENMSGFACPNCQECSNIFSSGGGKSLSDNAQIPFLGSIPIDPKVSSKKHESIMSFMSHSPIADALSRILDKLVDMLDTNGALCS